MNRFFRAGALALALLSGCDYFKNDAVPPGVVVAVADAGKKDDASHSSSLDERLEKYFVEDRIEREGMILGKEPEELIVNDDKTEYVNSIFVEGSENALRAVEQTRGRIISKIGGTYELFIPAHSVEERDTIRSQLEQHAIESFAHHLLSLDGHLDNDRAEQRGRNMWAYTQIQLSDMQHAISIENRRNLPPIAVIDTGFRRDDLNIVYQYDYAERDNDASPDLLCAKNYHGTAVAGIIAAQNNGLDGNGVVPAAPIYAYKVLSQHPLCGVVVSIPERAVIAALEDIMTKDIQAVNLSINVFKPLFYDQRWIVIQKLADVIRQGKFVVAAAGNSSSDISSRLDIPGLVVVGGTQLFTDESADGQQHEDRYTDSNYWVRDGWWLAAPSETVASSGGYYSGTSFAAPFVTGVGALIKSYGLSAQQAFNILEQTADSVKVTYPDHSSVVWHRINAYRAVCSVADCGEQPDERDAGSPQADAGRRSDAGIVSDVRLDTGREEHDAGRNEHDTRRERDVGRDEHDAGRERDAEAPERDMGRDGGAVGRDIGLVVSDAAHDAELPVPPDVLDGGLIDNDVRQPEPMPDTYELYVLIRPDQEPFFQRFTATISPDCTVENLIQETFHDDKDASIIEHPLGFVYVTPQDEIKLLTHENQWIDIGWGYYPQVSPQGSLITFSRINGDVFIATPGEEPTLLGDVDEIIGHIPLPRWRPDGEEIVVYSRQGPKKYTFISLFGETGEYSPMENVGVPLWQDVQTILYGCSSGVVGQAARLNKLCVLHRDGLQNEILRVFDDQNSREHLYLASDGTIAWIHSRDPPDTPNRNLQMGIYLYDGNVTVDLETTLRGDDNYWLNLKLFSPDGRLLAYYGRPDGVDVDGLYLFDRRTEQHCLLLGNATEAVWK